MVRLEKWTGGRGTFGEIDRGSWYTWRNGRGHGTRGEWTGVMVHLDKWTGVMVHLEKWSGGMVRLEKWTGLIVHLEK